MNLSSPLLILSHGVLPLTSGRSLGSLKGNFLSLLNKLDKLVLTHSLSRLIKLSNNPSGKNVKLLASSSLLKHRIIKFILFNYWSIQISYELMFLRLVIARERFINDNLLQNLEKLMLTHSPFRLIKLSNNPSGKKVKVWAFSRL